MCVCVYPNNKLDPLSFFFEKIYAKRMIFNFFSFVLLAMNYYYGYYAARAANDNLDFFLSLSLSLSSMKPRIMCTY